jgi:Phage integrase family
METRLYPDLPMGDRWWYRCLGRAGLVAEGQTSGERMHKARHTAGQRVLDGTGNLKAAQKLLGHTSISTTGDAYVDWDTEQLAESLLEAVDDSIDGIVPRGSRETRTVERKVEAAGIEPAQGSRRRVDPA